MRTERGASKNLVFVFFPSFDEATAAAGCCLVIGHPIVFQNVPKSGLRLGRVFLTFDVRPRRICRAMGPRRACREACRGGSGGQGHGNSESPLGAPEWLLETTPGDSRSGPSSKLSKFCRLIKFPHVRPPKFVSTVRIYDFLTGICIFGISTPRQPPSRRPRMAPGDLFWTSSGSAIFLSAR